MGTSHHKYSPGILSHLKNILETESRKGAARDFEIRVDEVKVIPRTSALELFENFQEFLGPDTETVSILLYRGQSQHNDKYQLYLKNHPLISGSLQGPSLEDQIQGKLSEQKRSFDLLGLKKQNKKLKGKLTRKKKYIQKLEETLLEHKTKRFQLGKLNLGELSSFALEGVIRRNSHWLLNVPGGKALAGAIEADTKALEGPEPEVQASFSSSAPPLSEQDQIDLATGREIRMAFSEPHLPQIQELLGQLAHSPEKLPKTLAYLKKNDHE